MQQRLGWRFGRRFGGQWAAWAFTLVLALGWASGAWAGPTTAATAGAPAPAWMPPSAFTEGLSALSAGDVATAAADIKTLSGTPLAATPLAAPASAAPAAAENPLATYLQFRLLMATATTAPDAAVAFVQAHPDFVFSTNLKARTLSVLAAQNRWADYLALYALPPTLSTPPTRQCQYWQAEIETKAFDAADAQSALALWQQGRALPQSCDAVVSWLDAQGRLDRAAYQARIRGAVIDGNLSFADLLVRQAARDKIADLKAFARQWREAKVDPTGAITQYALVKKATANDHALLAQALIWLAKTDPVAAASAFKSLPAHALPTEERDRVAQTIALKAAYTRLPQAFAWLSALPESVQTHETRTWTIRSALRVEDWVGVKAAIGQLSVNTAAQPEWQYWLARADEALGDKAGAEARWQALLFVPDYYGFLAADRLGVPFPWRSLPHPHIATEGVVTNPAVQLAFYLRAAGQIDDARRAFIAVLTSLPADQQPALAQLAINEQWYDRASIAIARLGKQDDPAWFALRYPMPWRDSVDEQAKNQGVTTDWLYAIMRRESLFMSDVGSGAGAQGLMQLMPATARWINRKADLQLDAIDLHDPATNITLGAAYLAHLNRLYDGQMALAVAAYNAGPGRVKQWRPEDRSLPGDVWVDTIVFDETRNYVRAVMGARVIYRWRSALQDAQAQKNPAQLAAKPLEATPIEATSSEARASEASQTAEPPPALLAWLTPVTPSGGVPDAPTAVAKASAPASPTASPAAPVNAAESAVAESVAQTSHP